MHISKLAIIASLFFVIIGCNPTEQPAASASTDSIAEQLIAFSPISGHWENPDFAGQFDNLRFVRQKERENGQIVCRLEGSGELWSRTGTIPFTVTGRSIGTRLEPKLVFQDKEVSGTGIVTRDQQGWPQCRMTFTYNGIDYQADLICVGDRAAAKRRVLSGDD